VRIEPTLRPISSRWFAARVIGRHFRLALARVPRSVCFSLREPWLASKAAISSFLTTSRPLPCPFCATVFY